MLNKNQAPGVLSLGSFGQGPIGICIIYQSRRRQGGNDVKLNHLVYVVLNILRTRFDEELFLHWCDIDAFPESMTCFTE